MLVNMCGFFVTGLLLLIRAGLRGGSWLVYAMGFGFLLAGGYRLWLYRHAIHALRPLDQEP